MAEKKMIANFTVLMLLIGLPAQLFAQEFVPLWPKGRKPNNNGQHISDSIAQERIWQVETPGFFCFPVNKEENSGTAVLICPGGGYVRVSYLYNGFNLARWFNTIGINAYVLWYRLPNQRELENRELAPLQDAQRAIKIIRSKAPQWQIKSDRIGVMGTSAGGHLASSLGTHLKQEANIGDSLDAVSVRPDFMILLSPVITMGEFAHAGSKYALMGADTSAANIRLWSNELQVTDQTPAAFLVHAFNDPAVKPENSLLFFEALTAHHINSSLHIFPSGGHGIRLTNNPGSTEYWTDLLEAWLKERQFLVPVPFK